MRPGHGLSTGINGLTNLSRYSLLSQGAFNPKPAARTGSMTTDTIIDAVETWACSIPLPKPLSFGKFTVATREYASVLISTRGGLVADCLGHTRRSPVDVAIADLLAPRLIGKDAFDLGERLSDLRRATLAIEQDGVIGRALSLVDICLWDIRAQALGVPVWRMLGGCTQLDPATSRCRPTPSSARR